MTLTLRTGTDEVKTTPHQVVKLLLDNPDKRYYLVKAEHDGDTVYHEPTAANQLEVVAIDTLATSGYKKMAIVVDRMVSHIHTMQIGVVLNCVNEVRHQALDSYYNAR